jgi:DNA-binding transcriptional ArsR family regulator
MTEVLLQKSVRATRVVALDQRSARALGDGVRTKILELLSHKPMTADELARFLDGSGNKKAVTTIRHHLDSLRRAGLIEASKLVEVRGALMKYYSPRVRAFSFEVPANFGENHAKLIHAASNKILGVLRTVYSDKKFLSAYGKTNTPCSLCKRNHLREYAALEILNHAIAESMESEDYTNLMVGEKEGRAAAIKA